VPLGDPRTQDEWLVYADLDPKGGATEAIYTRLDVGPQLFIDGEGVSFTMEYDAETETWDMGYVDLAENYPGGAWTVDIPGNDAFPAAVFDDAIAGLGSNAGDFTNLTDAGGVPTQLTWNVLEGSYEVFVFVIAVGPNGEFEALCEGSLVDDGEVDLPAVCLEVPEGLDFLILLPSHEFGLDVAYDGHRVRLQHSINQQLNVPFPFAPA
jgi:hypothetical protein